MTFREFFSEVKQTLIDNCADLGLTSDQIISAKFGDMPSSAPCIMIYATTIPTQHRVNKKKTSGKGRLYFFCCQTNEDHIEAQLLSLELAEKLSILLVENNLGNIDMPVDIDSPYSEISVSIVECVFDYFYIKPVETP